MRVFLLRHFVTVAIGDVPLPAEGIAQGQSLKPLIHHLAPNGFGLIVISKKLRAQQSLALLGVKGPAPVVSDMAYDAETMRQMGELITLIGSAPDDVLIVGHEPTCQSTRAYYYNLFNVPLDSQETEFPNGHLTVVDFAARTVTNY